MEEFKMPEIGTKEFNDLCSAMFGGKPIRGNCDKETEI